jgi:alanyl-tRNA synthetase
MTDRLYYHDPYQRQFETAIVTVDRSEGRTTVRLGETAFYPTSGGQPFDTGRITVTSTDRGGERSVRVVGVEEDGAGDIVHIVEASADTPLEPGQRVRGDIDWARRFDHMQQHTGQHLLSAAFDRLHQARTVGFHLGSESCTIDLSIEATPGQIAAAETEANCVVWDDRPVQIRFVTDDEAARLPLRKEPARAGTLRLIEIDGFDLSACGGTHVSRTGAVGVISVNGWERFKGGQRIEFVCGGRALHRLRTLRDHMSAAVRLLSVLPADVAPAIERLQSEAKELRRTSAAAQNESLRYRAEELARTIAEPFPMGQAVLASLDYDAAGLKTLATHVTSAPGRVAVFLSQQRPALVVVAASPDTGIDAGQLIRALIARHGGRGGGRGDLAQGGGLDAAPETILESARQMMRRSPKPE